MTDLDWTILHFYIQITTVMAILLLVGLAGLGLSAAAYHLRRWWRSHS